MRKSLFLIVGIVLFMNITVFGQEGVKFKELDFQQALETAKKEKKLLFIDCYTSWCGPCRFMATKVFIQKKLGDYFNSRFVCVKYDMEKGEGPELAQRFRVKAYPTFLVIDPDGYLRHKWLGAMGSDDFIAKAEESFDNNKAVGTMEKRYEGGERDKEFLSRYVKILDECEDSQLPDVINELMKVLSDAEKYSEDYRYIFEVVNKSPIGSLARNFYIDNREKFNEILGKDEVNRNIYFAYTVEFQQIFNGEKKRSIEEINQMNQDIESLKLEKEYMKVLLPYMQITKAMAKGDINHLITVCKKEFVQLPRGNVPKNLFYLYKDKATEKQKIRWDKLLKKISSDE